MQNDQTTNSSGSNFLSTLYFVADSLDSYDGSVAVQTLGLSLLSISPFAGAAWIGKALNAVGVLLSNDFGAVAASYVTSSFLRTIASFYEDPEYTQSGLQKLEAYYADSLNWLGTSDPHAISVHASLEEAIAHYKEMLAMEEKDPDVGTNPDNGGVPGSDIDTGDGNDGEGNGDDDDHGNDGEGDGNGDDDDDGEGNEKRLLTLLLSFSPF